MAAASAGELLREAAQGHVGVDRRLITGSILDGGPEAAQEVLAFARGPRMNRTASISIRCWWIFSVTGVFSNTASGEALDFLIDVVRRNHEDVNDELVQTLLPFGERAVEPLLKLYEELGEEQGSDIAFLLAGLGVRDPRVLALLLDRLQFDAGDGALCLELYHDPAAKPALETMLAEIPAEEVELRAICSTLSMNWTQPAPHTSRYHLTSLPNIQRGIAGLRGLNESERLQLMESPDAETRAAAAHSFFNQELDPKTRATLFRWHSPIQTPKFAGGPGSRWPTLPRTLRFETRCWRS